MKRRKARKSLPVMLLWSKREQLRFVEAVERFVSLVGDLEVLLAAKKRRSEIATRAAEQRKANAQYLATCGPDPDLEENNGR